MAQHLVETTSPLAPPWQVGCEFIAAARKLEPHGLTRDQAWDALTDMQAMADVVLLPKPEIWLRARTLQQRYDLHFWDALIISSCLHENVAVLYTEDLTGHRDIDGLKLIDPFVT